MKKVDGTLLRDLWLKKYHNTCTEELIATKPKEYLENPDWFRDYKITEEQYQEWVKEAKELIKKETKCSDKRLNHDFPWIDLQLGPSVIQEENETKTRT